MTQLKYRSVSLLVALAWRFLSTLRTMPKHLNGRSRG